MNLDDHLRLFADETRLRLASLLALEPCTVAELQDALGLGQSSVSGHLAKLKAAGLIHDVAEGSSRRYRLRGDLPVDLAACWKAVQDLAARDPRLGADRARLTDILARRGTAWVDRVAGRLHREYAPGRTWDSLCHGLLAFANFGRCVDVGAGDGSLVELLAPRCTSLITIDPAPAMVAAGRQRTKALPQVTWHQAPGEALPLPDRSADSVLFLQSLQYITTPAAALAEAQRVLVPGGRLLVITLLAHDHAEADRYGHRHRGFQEADLRTWCRGFKALRFETLPPESRPPRFQTILCTGTAP